MSLDGQPPAPSTPPDSTKRNHGTVTRSNPPIPLFIDDGQVPPEAYGLTSYTTRPPWMTDSGLLPEDTGPTTSYIVDGASLSPFETLSDPVAATAAGTPAATQPVATPTPVPYVPYHAPRRAGSGVFIKLFTLGVKLLPLAGVIVGGYFAYSYYFGPVPIVSKLLNPGAVDAPPPKSKVAVMMDMTKGAVSMNDSRVNFANELAEGAFSADANILEAAPAESAATPAEIVKQTVATTRSAATQPKPARSPGVSVYTDRYEPALPAVDTPARSLTNPEPVLVESAVSPRLEFLYWARGITVSGVRPGDAPLAFVDGVLYGLNDTVDHGLKITFAAVDTDQKILIFRDDSGALLGKRY